MLTMLRWSMVGALLSGACAVEPSTTDEPEELVSTTSSSAVTTSVVSTVPEPTTTTTLAGPVDISIDDEPLTNHDIDWEEGVSYVATRFFTPVAFLSPAEGWMSRGAGERWVSLVWTSPETGEHVSLSFLAYQQGLIRQAVTDAIVEIEGVDALMDPVGVSVAGFDATTLDVFGQMKDSAIADYQCTTQLGRWNWDSSGYPLVPFTDETEEGWEYGIPACFRSRIWVVDTDQGTVTIVATPDDPDRFEELVVVAEPLLANTTIGE